MGAVKATKRLIFDTIPNLFIQALAAIMTTVQGWGSSLGDAMVNIFNGIVNVVVNAINGLIEMTTSAINTILESVDDVADQVSKIPGVEDADFGRLEQASIDASRIEKERGAVAPAQTRQQNAEAIRTAVDLTIEGSGALADLLREETSAEVESQRRQDARRTNRQRPERR
jgi:hypothetical protein